MHGRRRFRPVLAAFFNDVRPLRPTSSLYLYALLWALLLCSCSRGGSEVVRVHGAGASFPAPLYESWIKAYYKAHPRVQIDYQSVGSGSGVKGIIDGTLDFGASDAAMTPDEMARVPEGVQLFPMTAGSIVLAYNLPGVSALKLSREAYAGIFLGHITHWNDPAISRANPGLVLPARPIHVIVRADSSGTTFVFTKHLSEVSPEFRSSPGVNKMPNWALGTRAKGNEGVTAGIESTPGAIGYVEYGYAKSQDLAMATLENQSGNWIAPGTESGQAALANSQLPDDMIVWNPDPKEAHAYPIVTYTWLILRRQYHDPAVLQALRGLVYFGLREGQAKAEPLGYIPLPAPVVARVLTALGNVQAIAQR